MIMTFLRRVAVAAAVFGVPFLSGAAQRASSSVTTNYVERWVTNSIEVRVPVNRIVSEYHTNVVQKVTTNVVDFYATNVVVRTVTNNVLLTVTQTNFVQNFQTNYRTLNLTNWSTVLVLKTNWVGQSVTNVVEVDIPRPAPQLAAGTPREKPAAAAVAPAGVPQSEALVIEAKRGTKAGGSGNVPVELKARWMNAGGRTAQVQQWRIEGDSGAFLCFGQEQEFQRSLPPGKYRVQVKARAGDSAATITAKATLLVSSTEVLAQQGILASR